MTTPDALDHPWCCLTCSWKGIAGELIAGGTKRYLRCPKCDSSDIHPIDRQPVDVSEYVGKIGTRN